MTFHERLRWMAWYGCVDRVNRQGWRQPPAFRRMSRADREDLEALAIHLKRDGKLPNPYKLRLSGPLWVGSQIKPAENLTLAEVELLHRWFEWRHNRTVQVWRKARIQTEWDDFRAINESPLVEMPRLPLILWPTSRAETQHLAELESVEIYRLLLEKQ